MKSTLRQLLGGLVVAALVLAVAHAGDEEVPEDEVPPALKLERAEGSQVYIVETEGVTYVQFPAQIRLEGNWYGTLISMRRGTLEELLQGPPGE